MRSRTSITLAPEVLAEVDRIAGDDGNRSRIIEQALIEFLESRRRDQREARDLAILNRSADELNLEAEDVLAFQAEV